MCGKFNFRSDDEFVSQNLAPETEVLEFVRSFASSDCRDDLNDISYPCEATMVSSAWQFFSIFIDNEV